jgi:hypothetical protein
MSSVPSTLPAAVLETILTRLATLFLAAAGEDPEAARHAATEMLESYHPETTDELRLAANIIGFSFQALEALAQAATPDMSLARVLRLRGGAVSLSREAAKAERRLAQLQNARQHAIPAAPESHPDPQPEPEPKTEKAIALIQDTAAVALAAKAGNLTWIQAHEQRQRDARIAASLQKAEATFSAQAAVAIQALPAHHGRATDQPAA